MHGEHASRGVILAAGRGQRLGALTADRPKCLVEVGGRALLDWQLAALRSAGVERVAVVRGYRAHTIVRPGLHVFDNPDWARGNMVASLLHARSWLRAAPCVLSYGDIAFHPDAVRALCATSADVAITCDVAWRDLWEARFARPEDDAETLRSDGGRLVEIGRPVTDLDAVEGQFMGLVRFTPLGWRQAEDALASCDTRTIQTTALLQRMVERGVPVATIPIDGRWCEIDSADDLALCERALARPGWRHDWRNEWPLAAQEEHG